jgi:drug/metabolite transporter (DMT)-like permease
MLPPMLSTIGALLILGEVPTARGLLGLILVVVGIGLIDTGCNRGGAAH